MPHISETALLVAVPFVLAIAFLLWFLWNLNRELRR